MTAITTIDPTAALLEPTKLSPPWLTRSLGALGEGFRPTIPEAFALTEAQRTTVGTRAERLAQHLGSASAAEIGKCIAILQAQFREREVDDGSAAARAEGYLMALEGVPLFALREAVRRVMRADAGLNTSFMPKAPEMRALVNEIAQPARFHLVQLRRLLEAKVERAPSERDRERVREMAASLAAALAPREGEKVRRRHPANPSGVDHSEPYHFSVKGE